MRTLRSTALAIGLDNARHDSDDDADHSRAGDEASGENDAACHRCHGYQHCSLLAVLVQFALRLAAGLSPVLCVELALPEQLVRQRQFLQPLVRLPLLRLRFARNALSD